MRSPENGPNRGTQPTRRDIMIGGAVATAALASLPDASTAAQADSRQRPVRQRDRRSARYEHGHYEGRNVEIFYKDWGKGQPIVFSHGWPLSADDWDAQMLFFLNHGYRVIAHDRRGHGRSTQTSDGHDMDHYADDLAAVTAHLDLKNAIHVGHSTGGGEVVRYLGAAWREPRGESGASSARCRR